MDRRRIAIVMVNYRTPALALAAAAALAGERAAEPDLRLVLADGGSADGSAERIAEGLADPTFSGWASPLPLAENGGFGWANNQVMLRLLQSAEPPDYIHLLNPDTVIEPGAVSRLADTLDRYPRCGAVGSQLVEPDGRASGSAFRWPTVRGELDRGARLGLIRRILGFAPFQEAAPAGEVDWVTGASVMLRAETLREVGLFDTGFFLYFEELELMWRITRGGWTIRHEPASRVAHVGGAATGVNGSRPDSRRPPRPAYWYESRRRFLTLTRGRRHALAASIAWLVGHTGFLARRALGSGEEHPRVAREGRHLLTHGLGLKPVQPAVAHWDDPPGQPPAWRTES